MTARARLGGILAILLLGSAASAAEGGFGGLFRPWPEGQVSRGGGNLKVYTVEDVEGSGEDFAIWGFGVNDTVPIIQAGSDELLFNVSYRNLQIDTGARLPRTPDRDFPEDLHRISLGLTYRHDYGDGRSIVLMARLGSASDGLFADETVTVSGLGMMRLPDGHGRNAWILGLSYRDRIGSDGDGDGPLEGVSIPLPVIAYSWAFGRRSGAVVGLPFSGVHAETENGFKFDFNYMLLRTVRAKVAYGLRENLDLYGTFAWDSESYWLEDRPDDDDRLAFYEKRLGLGFDIKLGERVKLGLETGWSFDRFVYEDEDYDDRKDNWLEIEDALYGKVVLKVSF